MNKCNFCVVGHEKVEDFVFSPLVARVNNCDISPKKCHYEQSGPQNSPPSARTVVVETFKILTAERVQPVPIYCRYILKRYIHSQLRYIGNSPDILAIFIVNGIGSQNSQRGVEQQ